MKKLLLAMTVALATTSVQAQTLVGSFPPDGGPITVTPEGGDVMAAGLDFISPNDGLIPIPPGDLTAPAAPFTFLLANSPGQVTYGNLGTSVTISAPLTLSVGANADAQIDASWGNGANPVSFEVTPAGPIVPIGNPLFSPGDGVLGGQSDGTNFLVGVEGTAGDTNNWPGAEGPEHIIDGVGQKYLNFGKTFTGVLLTPAAPTIVKSLKFWAANDAIERDPTGYELWGSNTADTSQSSLALADFTAIATGDLVLPDSRNDGGDAPLEDANAALAVFGDNTAAYTDYLLLFPDVKDNAGANSMQIAEVQGFGEVVPEPSGALLALSLLPLAMAFRRRRR